MNGFYTKEKNINFYFFYEKKSKNILRIFIDIKKDKSFVKSHELNLFLLNKLWNLYRSVLQIVSMTFYGTLFFGGNFRTLFFELSRIQIVHSQGDSITWTRQKNLKSSDVVGRRRFITRSETSYIINGNHPFTFYGRSHRGFLFSNAQWRLAFDGDC